MSESHANFYYYLINFYVNCYYNLSLEERIQPYYFKVNVANSIFNQSTLPTYALWAPRDFKRIFGGILSLCMKGLMKSNTYDTNPTGIYLPQVNHRNTRIRCEICSKLTIKTRQASFSCLYCSLWIYFIPCSKVFIVNFEHANPGCELTLTAHSDS